MSSAHQRSAQRASATTTTARRRSALRAELLDLDPASPASVVTLPRPSAAKVAPRAAFARFVEYCEGKNLRPKTCQDYRQVLGLVGTYLESVRHIDDLWAVRREDLEAWLLALRKNLSDRTGRPLSAESIASYGTQMLVAFHWLEARGLCPPTVTAGITAPRVRAGEKKIPQTFTDEQVRTLLDVAGQMGQGPGERAALTQRNRALLKVMLDAGPRASELLSMRVEDVDRERQSLLIRTSKTRLREVGIGRDTLEHLSRYIQRARYVLTHDGDGTPHDPGMTLTTGPLWINRDGYPLQAHGLDALFTRLRTLAGFGPEVECHPHTCRRYAITRALQGDPAAGRAGMTIMDASRNFAVSPQVIYTNYWAGITEETLRAAVAASPMDRLARETARMRAPLGGRRGSRMQVDALEE